MTTCPQTKNKPLSGGQLKLIACASMFASHLTRSFSFAPASELILDGIIGRIAFPLFCLMLAEGFFHTRSRSRYLLRVALLALVSEPFFDRALHGKWLDATHQNTCFTLALGLLLFLFLAGIREKRDLPWRQAALLQLLLIGACSLAALLLRFDYHAPGIGALAACFYGCEPPRAEAPSGIAAAPIFAQQKRHLALFVACGFLNLDGFSCPAAFLSLIPAYFYDGTRERGRGLVQILFYLFYPLHLLALIILS